MLTTLLDGQVMAEKHGSGSPRVLAMHGWARTRHDWAPVLGGYDAVAVDLAAKLERRHPTQRNVSVKASRAEGPGVSVSIGL